MLLRRLGVQFWRRLSVLPMLPLHYNGIPVKSHKAKAFPAYPTVDGCSHVHQKMDAQLHLPHLVLEFFFPVLCYHEVAALLAEQGVVAQNGTVEWSVAFKKIKQG